MHINYPKTACYQGPLQGVTNTHMMQSFSDVLNDACQSNEVTNPICDVTNQQQNHHKNVTCKNDVMNFHGYDQTFDKTHQVCLFSVIFLVIIKKI